MSVHERQYIQASGRPAMARGVRHAFGLAIRPEQMLEFFHDTIPSAPIPFDARFVGLRIEDEGADSKIAFHFDSQLNPFENCVELRPADFVAILKNHVEGLIPSDSELDGIEVSDRFTVILLRLKSDHFPPHSGNDLPMAHLRYEGGELMLLNAFEAIKKDRRIQISSKR